MLRIDSKPTLDKTMLKATISLFKRYNIILNIDSDFLMSDARIIIYPSVLFSVTNDNINSMYDMINDKLSKYFKGGEQSDDEEVVQD